MLIFNQDMDAQYSFNPKSDRLYTELRYVYGDNDDLIFIGVNLMLKGEILGTFDTMQEAFNEISAISNCPNEIYAISGCTLLWEDWKELCEYMAK